MAINLARPHVYDAVYPTVKTGQTTISSLTLFNQGASNQISYTDGDGSTAVNRTKGFEDTNLTEDGRVTECGIIVQHIGIAIRPYAGIDSAAKYAADVAAFYERGYAEFVVNEQQVKFTARLKDLVPKSFLEAAGAAATGDTTTPTTISAISAAQKGHLYDVGGIHVPRGVRFRLNLKWERPLALPSVATPRIEAELWGANLDSWNRRHKPHPHAGHKGK